MNRNEIHLILLYEFKLDHKAAEASRNINFAFGAGTVSERTAQECFQKFGSGDMSVEEKEGRGRPSKIDSFELKAVVELNPRTTLSELANEFNVDIATISRHLAAIGNVKKLEKWVPHDLTEKQQHRRFEIASSLLLRNKTEPFLDRIITCDEKWIRYDNRQRSGQWLDYAEAPKHFPKPDLFPKKTMVTVWWFSKGIIHYSFLEPGKTINSASYSKELTIVNQKLSKIWPALVNRKGPILLHDNARPHIGKITQKKLNQLGYEVLPHPPYSPDLSPTDYNMFKHLDHFLREKTFAKQEDIEKSFEEFISSRNQDFYKNGIERLLERWQKCVDDDGAYFD